MTAALLRYTALRLLLLLAVSALLALLGLRGLLLLAVALLVSGLVSLVLLRGTRDDLSRAIVARSDRAREAQAREDALDDEARARARAEREAEGPPPG